MPYDRYQLYVSNRQLGSLDVYKGQKPYEGVTNEMAYPGLHVYSYNGSLGKSTISLSEENRIGMDTLKWKGYELMLVNEKIEPEFIEDFGT
jgi:hypothetical protein